MSRSEIPCLNLAITRLATAGTAHFAIWVVKAPYPSGYVHHDRGWLDILSQSWFAWQEMFSPSTPPHTLLKSGEQPARLAPDALPPTNSGQTTSYSGRLMQHLGINLWEWLFDGPIQSSLDQSQGIAIGQDKPLRLRLEIRDADLIPLPWEIIQPQPGKPAVSVNQQLLFSRTTSDVDPLPPPRASQSLKILLVLGQNAENSDAESRNPEILQDLPNNNAAAYLELEREAATLAEILENPGHTGLPGLNGASTVPSTVDMLLQPSPAELIDCLETGSYNILFYAGHGVPGPDGGLLFLRPDAQLNGTELAQVLTRCRVTLAVFNTCWGAQPAQEESQAIPRSSLAEVLIHYGVPAVLGMRDSIADREALSFIEAFSQALAERLPIDRAVAVARQQLLTLYKFNQPAWTLPVLYMHPEFNGELIRLPREGITELPGNSSTWMERPMPTACLRTLEELAKVWPIRGGLMRVGRSAENDIVIQERWVSQRHAEIFCRDSLSEESPGPTYFLRDFSRYGTLIWRPGGWQRVHHREFPLPSGAKLKFGSSQGQTLEFIIEEPDVSEAL